MSAHVPLNGEWLIRPDPDDRGLRDRWWQAPSESGWQPIEVPSSWHATLGSDYHGVAWYRRTLPRPDGPPAPGVRTRLRFDAVATECRAWVNGVEVGRHAGDYIPFEFDITKAIGHRAGSELIIRVDQIHAPPPAPGVLTQNGHITKGFHDVLSLQHAGLWNNVALRHTGPIAIKPNGIAVHADARARRLRLRVEFTGPTAGGESLPYSIRTPDGEACIAMGCEVFEPGVQAWEDEFDLVGGRMRIMSPDEPTPVEIDLEDWSDDPDLADASGPHEPLLWSPQSPNLYTLIADLVAPAANGPDIVETRTVRFGFRTVATGGPDNRHILLNGKPILLRAVLHWGHEPAHIAPAPTPEQIREEFRQLKERGFNCVCLCMVYMPEHYYDIADEMGMLIWQEHPVWKSPMGDEHIPEYQRLFTEFFRRDRNHPSVILVSGACEHEKFNPTLARWWWETAERELPHTLKQIQTAFFGWSDLDRTDLYDEHTYDNSGRWCFYLNDVRAAISRLKQGPKPFILGETILSNAWPDLAVLNRDIEHHHHGKAPWWATRGRDECAAFERQLDERYGVATLLRFKHQAYLHNLNLRKFQSEALRLDPSIAGWVMNHLRDVPACRCGFMNDIGEWRYEPDHLRPFLGDAALLLETSHQVRGFAAGGKLVGTLHLSNFGSRDLDISVSVSAMVGGAGTPVGTDIPLPDVRLRAAVGEVGGARVTIGHFHVDRPTRVHVFARSSEADVDNHWRLWMFPPSAPAPRDVRVMAGLEFTPEETAPEFEEKCYSSGWGLPVETWSARPQIPALLLPQAASWPAGSPIPAETRLVVTHRLTSQLADYLEAGGRVLLLASRIKDALSAKTTMLWAGVPFIPETGPFQPNDSEWLVDLLHHDLTRRCQRAVPTGELGIADQVEPIIRFIHTHDSGKPTLFDFIFAARVGSGLLTVSSLDHFEDAGLYVLARLLRWAVSENAVSQIHASLEPKKLRSLIL